MGGYTLGNVHELKFFKGKVGEVKKEGGL